MKFNTLLKRAAGGDTTNLAGGRAHTQSPRGELVSILLTATLEIGSLFAAVLVKANAGADVLVFSDSAKTLVVNRRDSTLTLAGQIAHGAAPAGTNFHAIFEHAQAAYDRIVILSDMQGWSGHHTPAAAFAAYKQRTGADPRVYSFDLAGLGTLQFPERNVFCLAGFSDKAFQTMRFLEEDKSALLREIEEIEL